MESAIRGVLIAARKWARAREKTRRLADSKSAKPEELEKAKRELAKTSDALFKAIVGFERILLRRPKERNKGFDWNRVLGTIGNIAKAVETAARQPETIYVEPIDTTAEEV
jgi:hypothetical protein